MEHLNDYFVDNYGENLNIIYSSENIPGPGCNLEEFNAQICNKCSCNSESCSLENNCCCILIFNSCNYSFIEHNSTKIKVLSEIKLDTVSDSNSIFECNDSCSCSVYTCENRLVQFGPRKFLKVDIDPQKGFCLFTSRSIFKGEFICEYAGEVISKDEAKLRFESDAKSSKMNYIFNLREIFSNKVVETVIDPAHIGNIGRYINHSCNPNSFIIPVRVNSIIPKLAIFAKTNIEANSEITMSYSSVVSPILSSSTNLKPCFCSEANCLKYLPYDADV